MNDILDSQRLWWNEWNNRFLEDTRLDDQARRRGEVALSLLRSLNIPHPEILEVGCGNGWFSERLAAQGQVTGIDLADGSIKEAKTRLPNSRFLAGDICSMDLPKAHFDVVVTLETFAHIPDQRRVAHPATWLSVRPGHSIERIQKRKE